MKSIFVAQCENQHKTSTPPFTAEIGTAQNQGRHRVTMTACGESGEGGIRTLGPISETQHFQCCTIGRSVTSPLVGSGALGSATLCLRMVLLLRPSWQSICRNRTSFASMRPACLTLQRLMPFRRSQVGASSFRRAGFGGLLFSLHASAFSFACFDCSDGVNATTNLADLGVVLAPLRALTERFGSDSTSFQHFYPRFKITGSVSQGTLENRSFQSHF